MRYISPVSKNVYCKGIEAMQKQDKPYGFLSLFFAFLSVFSIGVHELLHLVAFLSRNEAGGLSEIYYFDNAVITTFFDKYLQYQIHYQGEHISIALGSFNSFTELGSLFFFVLAGISFFLFVRQYVSNH